MNRAVNNIMSCQLRIVGFWAYIIQLNNQLYLWYIQSFLVLSEVICIALHEASFFRPLYR